MYTNTIPVFARFQWLNHPQVIHTLSRFLKPPPKGRKGYDKVWMFRWLIYRQLMDCSYRDLESVSGIDYSTFIKFRQRLIKNWWFSRTFRLLTSALAQTLPSLHLLLDSSFVETYSKHDEKGSEYFGYKKKNGFKLHQIIDFNTRLPILQYSTPGARSDIVWGLKLIRAAPKFWNVSALVADKAYDGCNFVGEAYHKWKGIRIGIPLRRTNQEAVGAKYRESALNRYLKAYERTLNPQLLNTRTEIERYFSRKKRVFHLGEERTRHLKNFHANCYMTSIMEILEWLTTPQLWFALFTKLYFSLLT